MLTKTKRIKDRVMRVQCGITEPLTLRLSYVTKALFWSPKYRVEMKGKSVQITLIAEISNSAEEIVDVDICFATHMPSMTHKISSLSFNPPKEIKRVRDVDRADAVEIFHSKSECAMELCSVEIAKGGTDDDIFNIVLSKQSVRVATNQIPLLTVRDPTAQFIYKTVASEEYFEGHPSTVHRFCEFKNLDQVFTLIKSRDATFVVDGFCIGQGEFPRVRSNEKGMVKLHETFNVKSEVKTNLNRHEVVLTNSFPAPVEVHLTEMIKGELQGIPETNLITCTSKYRREVPFTHLLIKGTLLPGEQKFMIYTKP